MKSSVRPLLIALALVSCSEGAATGPSQRTVAGTYVASQFLLFSSDTTDVLAGAGYYTAILGATGRNLTFDYMIPNHPVIVSSFVGLWYLVGDTVLFHSNYPDFSNSLNWHYAGDSLVTTGWFSTDTSVKLVLKKVP